MGGGDAFEARVSEFLARGDIRVGGNQPWDVQVRDARFYRRVALDGTLGLGESYMAGWWDCAALDEFFHKLALVPAKRRSRSFARYWQSFRSAYFNLQSRGRAEQVADAHYNLSNALFEAMLDSRMQYSCAFWDRAENLEHAQIEKLDLICRKLDLQPTDKVLEIGGGWGGLAHHMAANYGCRVTSLNIADEQIRVARARNRGLPVEVLRQDYREASGTYDKVVSIEMLEAVGMRNFRTFMEVVERCLKPTGLFLVQTIAENVSRPYADRWIIKYIFPNGQLPSPSRFSTAIEGLFVVEDWHNLGMDYDPTLLAWRENFEERWADIRATDGRFDERFRRMWLYYLLSCAGSFRARNLQLWQVLLSKHRSGRPFRRPNWEREDELDVPTRRSA